MIRALANPAAQHLISYLAQTHGTSPQIVLSRCRYPRVSAVRAMICWLLYWEYECALSEIGRELRIDRSSVRYAVNRVDHDPVLKFEARESMCSLRALATAALPAETERTA